MRALKIGSVTLRVGDLEAAERLYRWSFRLEPVGHPVGDAVTLGWPGGEDRIHLLGGGADPAHGDAFSLWMAAAAPVEALEAVRAHALSVATMATPAAQETADGGHGGDAGREPSDGSEASDVTVITVGAPGGTPVALVFPSPPGGPGDSRAGPRRGDARGLETPGILGVTWGVPAPDAARAFLTDLGATPIEPGGGPDVPLRVGDQQVVIEDRATPAVYGLALVVPAESLPEVRRTLEHLHVELRAAGTRLLARDPGGRILIVHGVRAA